MTQETAVSQALPTYQMLTWRVGQEAPAYQAFTRHNIKKLPQFQKLGSDQQLALKTVAEVLPFRTNRYVVDHLVDWDNIPDDPLFQLNFPQRGMLSPEDFAAMARLVEADAPRSEITATANEIRYRLNPHPSGQMKYNVPQVDGAQVKGMQHKYRETVLFFPSQGQTCHAYCTYCFRWAQFVGLQDLKFASKDVATLAEYIRRHPDVTDILFTGGDPMTMKSKVLRRYLEPLLAPELDHLQTIRIGTKSVVYWPYRYVTDPDADDVLRLFERIIAAGRHVAIMAHYTHPRELQTPIAQEAARRLRDVGCEIRMQAPLVHHVNDDPEVWVDMWRTGVRLGMIPYYMFVERDTGPKNYFEVPLSCAVEVFRSAYSRVSGLGRTVRGPSMSATPGKVAVTGVAEVQGEKVFVLTFLQARNPDWVGRPFFARFDPEATWLDHLRPAFGQSEFFFEPEMTSIKEGLDVESLWDVPLGSLC